MIDVMSTYHAARGTTTTKQAAKRWAAMRLLEELKHVISPAFYKDTPEGQLIVSTVLASTVLSLDSPLCCMIVVAILCQAMH